MAATENTSNVNPMSAIIAGVLRDEATAQNRSAAMIAYMFDNEASYSVTVLKSIIGAKGADKTEAIDNALSDLSPEFASTLTMIADLKAIKSSDKTETEANRQTILDKQVRAARKMYGLAIVATYGLRMGHEYEGALLPVLSVTSSKKKVGSLTVTYNRGKNEKTGNVRELDREHTSAKLISLGEKYANAIAGKAPATKARNPQGNALADSAKAFAASVKATAGKPITDFSDEVSANMESALVDLMRAKFADDKGMIDPVEVTKWISETLNAAAKAKADAVKAGQEKLIAEEKARKAS